MQRLHVFIADLPRRVRGSEAANKVGLIFRTDMCRAKNTSRGADCASGSECGQRSANLLKAQPSEAVVL